MYKTKKEVDAHVRAALSKLRSESERHLRSFTIAKLYYKINEYASAEQYLTAYLSIKEDNDQAHKLLGQCYERLKKPDKALQSFQRSLQLNPKQSDILIEVCQLLLEDKNFNSNKAKFWCELAESEKVKHDAVFSLRLKLMNKENLESNQVEEIILKEISARPYDVQLRVRLVRNYIEQSKILDAFKYVYNLEMSTGSGDGFSNSSEWYNVVRLMLSKYEQMPNTKKDWEFWLLLAICLERQVHLSFSMTSGTTMGGVTETANLLFSLDQYLFKISQLSDKFCAQKELVALFLDHYRGQLLLHAVALIFKRELQQNKNKWKETVKSVLPLLILAFQIEAPDNKQPWMKHCDEQGMHLIQLWNREGAFRCAQVGRTLLSCIIDESADKENGTFQINKMLGNQAILWSSCDELLAQIRQTCSDKQWRRSIFALLFCNSDQKVKEQSSLLIRCPKLAEPIFELPTYAEVERYEEAAQYLRPQSLQHMVYLCLGNDNLAYVRAKFYSGLNFSTQNLSFCGAESLNQLDVDTFLYAAAIQAKRMLEVERDAFDNYNSGGHSVVGRPRILPFVNLHGLLCNEEQANWWSAAYQVYKNMGTDNIAELRANLQYGIEAVRGINGPKIDMAIVFRLGQIFVTRAQDIVKPVEKALLEARAESIYKYGLNMLKMHNKGVLEPFRKYFKYAKSNSSAVEREVAAAAEDGVSFMATRYFKKAEYEELIDELVGIQLPFATYLQAEAYRKLDEANKTPKKAKRMYLDRASECLNQTLALLRSTQTDPDHPLNSVIHSELKRLQHSTTKFLNDSATAAHSNSSTYEDAEADFFAESPLISASMSGINRSRREAAAALISSPRNSELESLVKQMATTLSFVKEEIVDTIKPEVVSMRKEIVSLKEKIAHLEDSMKKTRISSNPPSRDDACNVLDDLYIIEDALQNQLYQQNVAPTHLAPGSTNMFPSTSVCASTGSPFAPPQQSQQRIHTPNAMQMQPNVANAYNTPIFNPNYPMNYYTPPYMMTSQGATGAGPLLGQRNPLPLPFMDTGGMNFNMSQASSLLPQPSQENRPSNLYGLLAQQQNQTPQLPQLGVPVPMSVPMQLPTPAATAVISSTSAPYNNMPFNKANNNLPVEKGPPANVVITSSDPLPNPNCASLQAQQPTLSVTIPSHHIKPSLVQAPDALLPTSTTTTVGSGSMGNLVGFPSHTGSTSHTSATVSGTSLFSMNSGKSTSASAASTISTTTFTFKPQIMQAAQQANAALGEQHDRSNESGLSGDFNKSNTQEEVEYDPRPDFKPVIPLPDEIVVKTGEEDEEVIFCYRAKLYRHLNNEWKERGIGDIKILRNKEGYSRVLMRRDQTHKICANHKITKELTLTTPKNETKGHIWAANDFADEELKLEKFFVRFKLPETAKQFFDAFKQAQKEAEELEKRVIESVAKVGEIKPPQKPETIVATKAVPAQFGLAKSAPIHFATSTPTTKGEIGSEPVNQQSKELGSTSTPTNTTPTTTGVSKTLFSGLNLSNANSNTPTSPKPMRDSPFANFCFSKTATTTTTNAMAPSATSVVPTSTAVPSVATASPFANIFSSLGKSAQTPFSTGNMDSMQSPALVSAATSTLSPGVATKLSTSETDDDYVPTAQFNPVIPLPDLVEVSTGEEHELVLFEHRAKLLRFDKEAGEWKERGLGNMKLLQQKDDVNKVRLLMRREQVHKLCCNQRLYKDTTFKFAKNSQTAMSWAGQDYSENELTTEMLTVRFKTADLCKQFHEAVLKAQANMSSEAEEGKAKEHEALQKEAQKVLKEEAAVAATAKGFGDSFKPKTGAWSCQSCYVSNPGEQLYCVACDGPKDNTVPKKEPTNTLLTTATKNTFTFGFGATAASTSSDVTASSKPAFTFGMPATAIPKPVAATTITSTTTTTDGGFGDKFKPKAGSWACKECYLSNTADAVYCMACDAPKDDTVPKKEASSVLSLSNPSQKFSFGFPPVGSAATNVAGEGRTSTVTPSVGGFTFGIPTATKSEPDKPASIFGGIANIDASKSFAFAPPVTTSSTLTTTLSKPTFSFTLPTMIIENPEVPTAGTGASSTPFSLDKKNFSFTLKPKSPGKSGKTPLKFGGGGGDADGSIDEGADDSNYHEEEENNTYFTPVIPLPEKIDVKTGEEDEELLYVHRAKLYRFVDSEWKERGLGDVKILRHKETHKLRIVMRRDQVLKICLNHALNADIEYKRKDDKSWLFLTHDFSEGAVELEKFSLRFKNKEIAENFMEVVKTALAGTAVALKQPDDSGGSALKCSQTKTLGTNEKLQQDSSAKLQDADKKSTCSGCRGCNSDTFEFPVLKSSDIFVNESDGKPALLPLEMPALTLPKASRSLLKQSTLSPANPAPVAASGAAKLTENIFAGFGGPNSTAFTAVAEKDKTASTFSFTAALNSGGASNETKAGSGGFLFGSSGGGSLFTTDKKPDFGVAPSIFGGNTDTGSGNNSSANVSKSIFGGVASGGTSIFGGKPVFGVTPSIFGGTSATGAAALAKKPDTSTTNDARKSIFGNSSSTTNGTGSSIFGPSTASFGQHGFDNKSGMQTTIFGGAVNVQPTSVVADAGSNATKSAAVPTFADISNNAIDFASLAAKANTTSKESAAKPGAGGFIGLTDQDAFSSFRKPSDNNSPLEPNKISGTDANESYKSVEDSGSAANNDDNYDPYYEPIIALPNKIDLKTGEEDEKKLFGERATLFRWDATNKEWKERGVGELKILLHSTHQTYRLVMRREQIHKLVLNHAVGAEFTFTNMNNNPKSFVWATINYAESTEGEVEKLAVRFKKVDQAEQFSEQLRNCIEAAKKGEGRQQE